MAPESLPDRASDSGPDAAAEEARDWRDWLDEARENIHMAYRGFDDDPLKECALRLHWIDEALEDLQEARKLL